MRLDWPAGPTGTRLGLGDVLMLTPNGRAPAHEGDFDDGIRRRLPLRFSMPLRSSDLVALRLAAPGTSSSCNSNGGTADGSGSEREWVVGPGVADVATVAAKYIRVSP